MLSRREFLGTAAAATLAGRLAAAPADGMRLSLAAYGFRKYLDLKNPTMDLFGFIDFAAGLPLDAVELTSYYFAETTDAYLDKLKAHAAGKKLAISGVPVGNKFTPRDDAARQKEIDAVKAWTRRAARLGAETVRIFAGNLEKGDDPEAARQRVVAAIEECCAVAEKEGVILALENHGGITATPDELMALVKAVKSKAFGVNVDTGNFHTADPYADVAAIAPYGKCVQVKTEVTAGGKKQDADLKRFVEILRAASYKGYVVLEYEAAEEPTDAVPRHVKELRKLIGS